MESKDRKFIMYTGKAGAMLGEIAIREAFYEAAGIELTDELKTKIKTTVEIMNLKDSPYKISELGTEYKGDE